MDIMFVLVGIAVFCALVGVWGAIRKEREERSQETAQDGRYRVEAVRPLRLALLMACAATLVGVARAQEVIHATAGTIFDANGATDNFSLRSPDGSLISFHAVAISAKPITFEKSLRAQTVAATGQHMKGASVLVFYYGYGGVQTAVAIKDLGQADIARVSGVLEKFDRRNHAMTVAGPGSGSTLLTLTPQTIVDTPDGVIEGNKFHPDKAQQINAMFSRNSGQNNAVLIDATGFNAR
jgi:hypothetical protein